MKSLAKFQEPAFGGQFDMRRLLELAENDAKVRDAPCAICGKAPPKSAMGITTVSEERLKKTYAVDLLTDKVRSHLLRQMHSQTASEIL